MKLHNRQIFFVVLIAIVWASLFFSENSSPSNLDFFDKADTAWMIVASALVLLMTPGLAFFYGGMVGKKNVISTMLQSFISLGVISLIWVAFGFSLSFGESVGGLGIIGDPSNYIFLNNISEQDSNIPFLLFALFFL